MGTLVSQIAKKAGVAVSSAYEILSHPENSRYQEKTCKKVLEASRELDYRPHAAAKAIRTGRFECITLLMSTAYTHSYLPNNLLYGIHDELDRRNIHLTINRLSDEMLTNEKYLPKILRYQMSDGLLINYTNYLPPQVESVIKQSCLPAVWINFKRDFCCVYPDSFLAGRQATEYLLKMGHRRIAFLDYLFNQAEFVGAHFSINERCKGYETAMQEAGLSPRIIRPESGRIEPGEEIAYTQNWLRQPDRPTAVIAYWVASALPVMQGVLAAGLSVPRDLSIVTFNSETFGGNLLRESGLYINSMIEPEFEMGTQAALMMIKKIKKPSDEIPSCRLEFKLEEFGTCCPPKAK
ncbi:MAG TPA: LacI family DNA-binding transcriptional regulator [Phycisphaerae bacterium]|nr:LacI family DNA-binding transcriptional regulator [Phycisphaerae bacterium]